MADPLEEEVFHEALDLDHPPAFIVPLAGPGIEDGSSTGDTDAAEERAAASVVAACRLPSIISLATLSATLVTLSR